MDSDSDDHDDIILVDHYYDSSIDPNDVDTYLLYDWGNARDNMFFEYFSNQKKLSHWQSFMDLMSFYDRKMERFNRHNEDHYPLMKRLCFDLGEEMFHRCQAMYLKNSGSTFFHLWKEWSHKWGLNDHDMSFEYLWERIFV